MTGDEVACRRPDDGLELRPASPGDSRAIATVVEQTWRGNLARHVPTRALSDHAQGTRHREIASLLTNLGPRLRVLVAVSRGEVVGFVWFGPRPDELPPFRAQVYSLHVACGSQRAGVGTRLLGAAARDLWVSGSASMMLWTLKTNRPARSFYERCGGVLLPSERPFRFREFTYPSFPLVAYGWPNLPDPWPGPEDDNRPFSTCENL